MNSKARFLMCLLLFWSFVIVAFSKHYLNPLNYGLEKAQTPIERFYILEKVHYEALRKKWGVSYKGLDSIVLEIPKNANSIPLTSVTDFSKSTFVITNRQKDFTLFNLIGTISPDDKITWANVVRNEFSKDTLPYIIVVQDMCPWVENRKGFDFGHVRKDVLLVNRGKAQNRVIYSYGTKSSQPKFSKAYVSLEKKCIKNLVVIRDSQSTFKTYIVKIANQNNVELNNIKIVTPPSISLYRDAAIQIENCTNVKIQNCTIDGTYSQKDKWGYGINMNNIWNLYVNNLRGNANWGVFGDENINTATLEKCDINRFDIHCYGKDIIFNNCRFRNLYNQFSSLYGTLSFRKCEFFDFVPVLLEPSYNAYTGFDIIWKDCIFHQTKRHDYLVKLSGLGADHNSREELYWKCVPNITMNDCKVDLDEKMGKWYLVYTGRVDYKDSINYLKSISIENLELNRKDVPFDLFTSKLLTKERLRVNIEKMYAKRKGKKSQIDIKGVTTGDNTDVVYDGMIIPTL